MLTEANVVDWANARVAGSQGSSSSSAQLLTIQSLKDTSLSNGLFLLELIRAIEPRAVDTAQLQHGATSEERTLNAKYAISCARRLGCMVFLLHEDIVEVKPKMLLTFVATLMSYDISNAHP